MSGPFQRENETTPASLEMLPAGWAGRRPWLSQWLAVFAWSALMPR